MNHEAPSFSLATSTVPTGNRSQDPRIQTPASNDDLFAVFGMPELTPTNVGGADAQMSNGSTPSKHALSMYSPVKPSPPAGRPTSLTRPFSSNKPVQPAALDLSADVIPIDAASEYERQFTRHFPGQYVENNLAPNVVSIFDAMIDHLNKIDTKYTKLAPDLVALEKLVDTKMKTMPKGDPKRKALMEQFLDLKRAHINIQTAALRMRANAVGERKEERKKKAAVQSANAKTEQQQQQQQQW